MNKKTNNDCKGHLLTEMGQAEAGKKMALAYQALFKSRSLWVSALERIRGCTFKEGSRDAQRAKGQISHLQQR